jgi:transcriptional regulator with XRE-family HTH domain
MIEYKRGITMKSKEEIAKVLKDYRQKSGLTSKDVTVKLNLKGVTVSPKTLYGWESGHSQPDADTLLLLCDIYGIDDIMFAFGYGKKESRSTLINSTEKSRLLDKVEQLDESSCKVVSAYIDGLLTE